jgi:hypothetical protein
LEWLAVATVDRRLFISIELRIAKKSAKILCTTSRPNATDNGRGFSL